MIESNLARRAIVLSVVMLTVGSVLLSLATLPATATMGQHADASKYVSLDPFLSNLDRPVHLIAGGLPGDGRLFIVQQGGKILVVNPDGTVRAKPFLNISDRVDQSTPRTGMFGLAFHPAYQSNGYFYVYYLHRVGDSWIARLSRFRVTNDPNIADAASENILLTVTKTQAGHNGGDLAFGPDGYLYYPLGDGDSRVISGRPQDPASLLGKVIRINVDKKSGEGSADCKGQGSGDYSIPPSNPFAGSGSACDEIWASGLRNPWRFSFDRLSGDLYLSDVGESAWDELNFQAQGSPGGRNFGWPCYEASVVFEAGEWSQRKCDASTQFTFPVYEQAIGSAGDCSVMGGYVYRGALYPALVGRYFMSDYCSGRIRSLTRDGIDWAVITYEVTAPPGVVSFGQGNDGQLYLVNREQNEVYRLVGQAGTPAPTLTATPTLTVTPDGTPTATPIWSHWNYLPIVELSVIRK